MLDHEASLSDRRAKRVAALRSRVYLARTRQTSTHRTEFKTVPLSLLRLPSLPLFSLCILSSQPLRMKPSRSASPLRGVAFPLNCPWQIKSGEPATDCDGRNVDASC